VTGEKLCPAQSPLIFRQGPLQDNDQKSIVPVPLHRVFRAANRYVSKNSPPTGDFACNLEACWQELFETEKERMKCYQCHLILVFVMSLLFRTSAATLYVDLNSTDPVPPYTNWATAATAIQDAINASTNADLILVADGAYSGNYTNVVAGATRVYISQAVTVQSVNGPAAAIIRGQAAYPAVECVYLVAGATLSGFTLTAGKGLFAAGGAQCQAGSCILSNCIITGNTELGVTYGGQSSGGVSGGTLYNCVITGNSGGEFGGVNGSTLYNCLITGNSAPGYGTVPGYGGGVAESVCYNCTLVGNSAEFEGGGAVESTLYNCIIYYNTAPYGTNDAISSFTNCCTPDGGDVGNITNQPIFIDPASGDYRLQTNSPCINAGNNAYVAVSTDLDGRPRIVGGTVDIGAYEFQGPGMGEFIAWLQQYNLPTDGSVDNVDLDGAGFTVYQDWIAGLNPTSALSTLAVLPPVRTINPAGLAVSWQSMNNRTYLVQCSTNLSAVPAFVTIQSNIVGQSGTTTYTDTNAVGNGPFFYRVGVQ
jgi:hypothetical protein